MPTTNPYQSPTVACRPVSNKVLSRFPAFLAIHLVVFQVSFWFLTFVLAVYYAWDAGAIRQLLTPNMLCVIGTVGICSWMPHTLLSPIYKRIRNHGLIINAIVGAVTFSLGYTVYLMINQFAPESVSALLRGTPGYARIASWAAVSVLPGLATIWIFRQKRRG